MSKPSSISRYFYPRPPGEGRRHRTAAPWTAAHFYPRPPGEGRPRAIRPLKIPPNFYPRPPGEGRHFFSGVSCERGDISIHVPRARDDNFKREYRPDEYAFLSTSPGRGTTANVTKKNHCALPPFVKINTMHKYSIYILCSLYSHMPLGGIAFVIFPVRKLAPFSVRLGVAPAAGPAAPAAYGTASRRVTPTAHRPAATVARARRARPSFCTGCPAGKSAGCPPRGRSAPSARP